MYYTSTQYYEIMTQIKYIIDDNQITFSQNGELKIFTDRNWVVFENLKQSLIQHGNIGSIITSASNYFKEAVKSRSNKFGIKDRLEALEAANMPTEPFKNFISRANESFLEAHPELVSKAGTVDAPLTWDGNLIMYQRAAWRGHGSWSQDESFTAFKTIEGTAKVSEFTAALQVCPDTGAAFEVIVQPEDLVSVASDYCGLWVASKITQLAKLGVTRNNLEGQQAQTPIIDVMTNCVGEDGNAIRLPFNAGTAAKLVQSMFDKTTNSELMNNIVPVRMAVATC